MPSIMKILFAIFLGRAFALSGTDNNPIVLDFEGDDDEDDDGLPISLDGDDEEAIYVDEREDIPQAMTTSKEDKMKVQVTTCHAHTNEGVKCDSKQKHLIGHSTDEGLRFFCGQHLKMWKDGTLKGMISLPVTSTITVEDIMRRAGAVRPSEMSVKAQGGAITTAYLDKEADAIAGQHDDHLAAALASHQNSEGLTIVNVIGHRPVKLPGGYNEADPRQKALKREVLEAVMFLEPDGIVSGCALGPDQWGMRIGVAKNIPFVGIMPFKGFYAPWPDFSKQRLIELLNGTSADLLHHLVDERELEGHKLFFERKEDGNSVPCGIVHVSPPGYTVPKMYRRNEVCNDVANVTVAVINEAEWEAANGEANIVGGTAGSVRYALSQGHTVIPVHPHQ